jgi:hypothetical protein
VRVVNGLIAITFALGGCLSAPAGAASWQGVGVVDGQPETGGEREYWIDVGSIRHEGDVTRAEVLVVYQRPVHESWLSQVNVGEFRCDRFAVRETNVRGYRSRVPVGQPLKEVTAGMEWETSTRGTIGGDIVEAACSRRATGGTTGTHQWELLTTSSELDEIYVDRNSMHWNGSFRVVEVAMTETDAGERGAKSRRSRIAFDCKGARVMQFGARAYATRADAAFDEEALVSPEPALTGSEHDWVAIPASGAIAVIAGAVCPAKVPQEKKE